MAALTVTENAEVIVMFAKAVQNAAVRRNAPWNNDIFAQVSQDIRGAA